MIGKIIGAFVGDKLAKQTSGVGGATGAALGCRLPVGTCRYWPSGAGWLDGCRCLPLTG